MLLHFHGKTSPEFLLIQCCNSYNFLLTFNNFLLTNSYNLLVQSNRTTYYAYILPHFLLTYKIGFVLSF